MVLRIILTLLVSAVIGYATNYIAVKMLFRPLKPVYIKGVKLPFTPGIIPREQPRLAKALGKAVGDTLLTQDDLEKLLLSDDAKKAVSGEICRSLYIREDSTVKGMLSEFTGNCTYSGARDGLKKYLCDRINTAIKEADIGSIVVTEGVSAIKDAFSGGMMAMFITDDLINSVSAPIKEKINVYIENSAPQKIEELVENELSGLENKTAPELLTGLNINEEKLSAIIGSVYSKAVGSLAKSAVSGMNIQGIVEDKVNAMPVEDLEKLVMSVMKKELNSVINLGALIGLVIGVLNVLINL